MSTITAKFDDDSVSDDILITHALSGGQQGKDSIQILLTRYAKYLRGIVSYGTPDDLRNDIDVNALLQDLFLTILTALQTYNPNRGPFRQWLGGVTRNLIRAAVRIVRRDKKLLRGVPQADVDEEADDWLAGNIEAPSGDSPIREARRNEIRSVVQRLLARLPEDDRILLERYHMDGERLATIAAELGVSMGAVAMRLVRIRCRCLTLLGAENKYFTTIFPPRGQTDEQSTDSAT